MSKKDRARLAWGVALLVIAVSALLAARVWHQSTAYSTGRISSSPATPVNLLVFAGLALLGIGSMIGLIVWCIDHVWRSRAYVRAVVVSTVMFVLAAAVLWACVATAKPGPVSFLEGFRVWVKERVPLDEIRTWSRSINPDPSWSGQIPEEQWPEVVRELRPEIVSVHGTGADRELLLWWGGGFMHWGLAVGDDKNGRAELRSRDPSEWTLTVDRAAYVWVD